MERNSVEDVDNVLAADIVEEKQPRFMTDYETEHAELDIISLKDGIHFPEYTLSYGERQFAPKGGLYAVTGQSGQGKSMFLTIIAAAIIRGERFGLKWNLPEQSKRKVLYIDTEQDRGVSTLTKCRIHELAELPIDDDSPKLFFVNMRKASTATERWKKFIYAFKKYMPDMVIIDGLLDMVQSMNTEEECQKVVFNLMEMSDYYNVGIWCVLHQNPNDKNIKMAGHLGSYFERKGSDVFCVSRRKEGNRIYKDQFVVEHTKGRSGFLPQLHFGVGASRFDNGKNTWWLPNHLTLLPDNRSNDKPDDKSPKTQTDKSEENDKNEPTTPKTSEAVQAILSEEKLNELPVEPSTSSIMNKIFSKIGDALSVNKLENAIKTTFHYGTDKARKVIEDAEKKRIIEKEQAPNKNGNVFIYNFFTNCEDGEPPF